MEVLSKIVINFFRSEFVFKFVWGEEGGMDKRFRLLNSAGEGVVLGSLCGGDKEICGGVSPVPAVAEAATEF